VAWFAVYDFSQFSDQWKQFKTICLLPYFGCLLCAGIVANLLPSILKKVVSAYPFQIPSLQILLTAVNFISSILKGILL
jgi:hypothetical protein